MKNKFFKNFELVFMSFAPIFGVVCVILALKNSNLILGIIAVILFILVVLRWDNYDYLDGYRPNDK